MHFNDKAFGKPLDPIEVIKELRRRIERLERGETLIETAETPDYVPPGEDGGVSGVLVDLDDDGDAVIELPDGLTIDARAGAHLNLTEGDRVTAVLTGTGYVIVEGPGGGAGRGAVIPFSTPLLETTTPATPWPITSADSGHLVGILSQIKPGTGPLTIDVLLDGEVVATFNAGQNRTGLDVRLTVGQRITIKGRSVGAEEVAVWLLVSR